VSGAAAGANHPFVVGLRLPSQVKSSTVWYGRATRELAVERILIADDHPMVRGALAFAIEAAFGRAEIVEASSLDELMGQLGRLGIADLVLLDLLIPGAHGFSGLLKLRSSFPETPVLVISALEDPKLVDVAIALGAAGFVPKSSPR